MLTGLGGLKGTKSEFFKVESSWSTGGSLKKETENTKLEKIVKDPHRVEGDAPREKLHEAAALHRIRLQKLQYGNRK